MLTVDANANRTVPLPPRSFDQKVLKEIGAKKKIKNQRSALEHSLTYIDGLQIFKS